MVRKMTANIYGEMTASQVTSIYAFVVNYSAENPANVLSSTLLSRLWSLLHLMYISGLRDKFRGGFTTK